LRKKTYLTIYLFIKKVLNTHSDDLQLKKKTIYQSLIKSYHLDPLI